MKHSPRHIFEAEVRFNARIVVAFQAGSSVADIVAALNVQPTIIHRVLRAAGLMEPGQYGRWR